MSKTSVHLGISFPLRGEDKGSPWIRADVELNDIDVDLDVDAQINRQLEVIKLVAEKGEDALVQVAANASNLAFEGAGWERAFGDFKEKLKSWQENIVGEIRRQRDELEKVSRAVPPQPTEAELDRAAATKAAKKTRRTE